jgi:transposase-like protein
MVRPDRDRLTGEIEVDETYVGGPEEGEWGREIEKKSIAVVAIEKNGRAIGRIRLKRVRDVSAESLLDFIRVTVEPGATIHTDGWKSYAELATAGYKHRVTVISERDRTSSRSHAARSYHRLSAQAVVARFLWPSPLCVQRTDNPLEQRRSAC